MKKQVLASLAALLLLPLLVAAQAPAGARADISFEFHVGKTVLPAGSYEFVPDAHGDVVSITNVKTKNTIQASVLTSISQRPGNDSVVVFDKVGAERYLSELHIAGMDGYHLTGAPGPHSHEIVKMKK